MNPAQQIGLNAGANLLGSGIQGGINALTARYNYDMQYQMWQKMQEYNSPANQMQRLKDAGLNPMLMYGQGNTGNASTMPEFKMESPHLNRIDPASVLNQYQDMRLKAAQVDNVQQQANLARQNVVNAATTNLLNQIKYLDSAERYRVNMQPIYQGDYFRNRYQFDVMDKVFRAQNQWKQGELKNQLVKFQKDFLMPAQINNIMSQIGERDVLLPARLKDIMSTIGLRDISGSQILQNMEINKYDLNLHRLGFSKNTPAWFSWIPSLWDRATNMFKDSSKKRYSDYYKDKQYFLKYY